MFDIMSAIMRIVSGFSCICLIMSACMAAVIPPAAAVVLVAGAEVDAAADAAVEAVAGVEPELELLAPAGIPGMPPFCIIRMLKFIIF